MLIFYRWPSLYFWYIQEKITELLQALYERKIRGGIRKHGDNSINERSELCKSAFLAASHSLAGFDGAVGVGNSLLKLRLLCLLACPRLVFLSVCHMYCLRVRKQVGTSPTCRRAYAGKLLWMNYLCHFLFQCMCESLWKCSVFLFFFVPPKKSKKQFLRILSYYSFPSKYIALIVKVIIQVLCQYLGPTNLCWPTQLHRF